MRWREREIFSKRSNFTKRLFLVYLERKPYTMSMFSVILIALWLYPILAVIVIKGTKRYPHLRKKIAIISSGSALFITLSMIVGISTRSSVFDCLVASTIYLSLLLVLLSIYSSKHQLLKIISGFILIFVLVIGYISGSVGLLGVGLILNDFQIERTIYLTNDIVFKQYNLGSAPGYYRGIKVSVAKRPIWLPFLEYEAFNKKYDRVFNYKKSDGPVKSSYAALFSDDFDVKFNSSNKTLILMDSIKKDTIHLK